MYSNRHRVFANLNLVEDFIASFKMFELCITWSLYEVRQRYRRSILGPMWITLSMGIMLTAMGPVYSSLLQTPLNEYFRSLTIGFVLWAYISNTINDATTMFVADGAMLKNISLPLNVYFFKLVLKNIILLLHNALIIVVVYLLFPLGDLHYDVSVLLAFTFFGFIIVTINIYLISFIVSFIALRYRDIPPLVSNMLQVLFFLTPILWDEGNLPPERKHYLDYNYFVSLLNAVKLPLLGNIPSFETYLILGYGTAIGMICILLCFKLYKNRLVYWV